MEKSKRKNFNLLVNASNQANVCDADNYQSLQVNSLFLFVSPYQMDCFELDDLDLNIKVNDEGDIWINNQTFKTIEIKPGVNILGIIARK